MRRSEPTGQIFGELSVKGLSEISRNNHSRWHVVCSCGTEKTVLGTHLLSGKIISCGCKMREAGKRNWKGIGGVSATYFASLERGANGGKGRKPIPFEITLEYIAELLEKQNYKCALSGLPISVRSRSASLDRVDSSLGYIEGNLQWLHKDVNMMKRHYTQDYFKHLCQLISDGCEVVDIT